MRMIASSGPILKRVSFYPGKGVMIEAGGRAVAGRLPGRRGIVKGWSSKSRRRMREFLVSHEPPAGWNIFGASFTIPGPVLEAAAEKALFSDWSCETLHRGWCAVWRLELQKRGARHWHCIVGIPTTELNAKAELRESWFQSLDKCGPAGVFASRRFWPGAQKHAVDIQSEGGRGAWLRYLQDHATKSKQAQIGEGVGRHWGIIGRKLFREILPNKTVTMTDPEFFRFLRAFRRLCTPSFDCRRKILRRQKSIDWSKITPAQSEAHRNWMHKQGRKPFETHLGRRCHRGGYGTSVWFSRPETVFRLVEWAKA